MPGKGAGVKPIRGSSLEPNRNFGNFGTYKEEAKDLKPAHSYLYPNKKTEHQGKLEKQPQFDKISSVMGKNDFKIKGVPVFAKGTVGKTEGVPATPMRRDDRPNAHRKIDNFGTMRPETSPVKTAIQTAMQTSSLKRKIHTRGETKRPIDIKNCILEKDGEREMNYHLMKCPHHLSRKLCPDLLKCSRKEKDHKQSFVHICQWGSFCRKNDPEHNKIMIHIKLDKCGDSGCDPLKAGEKHLKKFFHENFPSFRTHCKYKENCVNKQLEHLTRFHHPKKLLNCSLSFPGLNNEIDFSGNIISMNDAVDKYLAYFKLKDNYNELKADINNYISALAPVHRCKFETLQAINTHGCLVSKNVQDRFQKDRKRVILLEVFENEQTQDILRKLGATGDNNFQDWIYQLVNKFLPKNEKYKAEEEFLCRKKFEKSLEKKGKSDREIMESLDKLVNILKTTAEAILSHKFSGIGFEEDKEYGTDKSVFAIIGDNTATYYGEVIIQFNKEIMHHPDFSMTPIAAFHFQEQNLRSFLPWVEGKGNEAFKRNKVHPAFKNWKEVMSKILFAKIFHNLTKQRSKPGKIQSEDIKKFQLGSDAHEVFEGHLPEMIPLNMIDTIYIPEKLFDKLTYFEKKKLRAQLNCEDSIKHYTNEADFLEKYSFWEQTQKVKKQKHSMIFTQLTGLIFSVFCEQDFIKLPLTLQENYPGFTFSSRVKGKNFSIRFMQNKDEYLQFNFTSDSISFEKNKKSVKPVIIHEQLDQINREYFIDIIWNKPTIDLTMDSKKPTIDLNKPTMDSKKPTTDLKEPTLPTLDLKIDNKSIDKKFLELMMDELWNRISYVSIKCWKNKVIFNSFSLAVIEN